MSNNCQSDNTKLERLIRTSQNEMISLYSLLSSKISAYFEAKAGCCVDKNGHLKSGKILIDDLINFDELAGEEINDVVDLIIDKLLENAPEVIIQFAAAFYREICVKSDSLNLDTTFDASFTGHLCRLMEEPLPDFTYEAEFDGFVCQMGSDELFPYAYEAAFLSHKCILRDGNYFYAEYEASYINFVCEFTPACDTFSTILCSTTELIESCELSMTSEWLGHTCQFADLVFDIDFYDHCCIRNMSFEAAFERYVCIVQDWDFIASFIDFVCVAISITCTIDVELLDEFPVTTTTSTTEELEVTTTTTEAEVTSTTTEEVTTTTTAEVTTTTTTQGVYPVEYGALYNWYAATDARYITNTGWHVPTKAEMDTLVTYLGGATGSGAKIKEVGTTYWGSDPGSTNSAKFNARGSGKRAYPSYSFALLNTSSYLATQTDAASIVYYSGLINSGDNNFVVNSSSYEKEGHPIRLIKDSTALSDGETGTYTGNDGKVYRTICIGTQEWLADNLAETKYRNGDWITGYDGGVYTPIADATWATLSSGALCAYDDNWSNV